MPEADADAVRVEIDTELDDPDIDAILTAVERDWKREYDTSDFADSEHIADFEAVVAAFRIGTTRDPRAAEESRESARIVYDSSQVDALKSRVRMLDPGHKFGRAGVIRDTSRHVTSTGN